MRVWAMAQTVCVLLDDATKLALSTIAGDRSRPLKHILRARIVLLLFERLSVQDVARQAGVSRAQSGAGSSALPRRASRAYCETRTAHPAPRRIPTTNYKPMTAHSSRSQESDPVKIGLI